MFNLIIFGPPGAGKGTQAKIIAEKLHLYHLSSGELLRQAVKDKNYDKEIGSYLDAGKLVPDDLIIKLIATNLETHFNNGGIVFDGYPRTLFQAKSLDDLFAERGIDPITVVNLELEDKIAIERVMSRNKSSNRSDDNLPIISERFKVYHDLTEPLLNYYESKGRLVNVDGRSDIEKVNKDIEQILKKHL